MDFTLLGILINSAMTIGLYIFFYQISFLTSYIYQQNYGLHCNFL